MANVCCLWFDCLLLLFACLLFCVFVCLFFCKLLVCVAGRVYRWEWPAERESPLWQGLPQGWNWEPKLIYLQKLTNIIDKLTKQILKQKFSRNWQKCSHLPPTYCLLNLGCKYSICIFAFVFAFLSYFYLDFICICALIHIFVAADHLLCFQFPMQI